MSNAITTTYGSCLNIDLEYFDETGAPEDITNDDFGILSASSDVFSSAVFTKTDSVNGKLHLFLSEDDAKGLGSGNVNWFRIRRTFQNGCEDNTPQIWVNVR